MRLHADPTSNRATLVLDDEAEVVTRLATPEDDVPAARGIVLRFDQPGRLVAIDFEDAGRTVPPQLLASGDSLLAEHDAAAGAAYLYLQPIGKRVADTLAFAKEEDRPAWGINLDFDAEGHLVGVEFETDDLAPPALLEHARRI